MWGEREKKRESKCALNLIYSLLAKSPGGRTSWLVSTLGLNVMERGNIVVVVPVNLAQTLAWPCASRTTTVCDVIMGPVKKKHKNLN